MRGGQKRRRVAKKFTNARRTVAPPEIFGAAVFSAAERKCNRRWFSGLGQSRRRPAFRSMCSLKNRFPKFPPRGFCELARQHMVRRAHHGAQSARPGLSRWGWRALDAPAARLAGPSAAACRPCRQRRWVLAGPSLSSPLRQGASCDTGTQRAELRRREECFRSRPAGPPSAPAPMQLRRGSNAGFRRFSLTK